MADTVSPPPGTARPDLLLLDAGHFDSLMTQGYGTVPNRKGEPLKTYQLALSEVAGLLPRGAWLTGTSYALRDLVTQSGTTYICTIAHTSGTFSTDLSSGKWGVYQGVTGNDLSAQSGAGIVGYSYAQTYSAGTVGSELKKIRQEKTYYFNTTQNMLDGLTQGGTTADYVVGDICTTIGYGSAGDGGGATFRVVSSASSIGIANTAGTVKFQRMQGHDSGMVTVTGRTPLVSAHRGYHGISEAVGSGVVNVYFVPENSLVSTRFAASHGADMLEADTKITSDGQLVVFHDDNLSRVTSGAQTGLVSSYSLATLKTFDVGSYVNGRYADTRILTYDEWFYNCKRVGLIPIPEVSAVLTDAQADSFVASMVKHYPGGRGVFVMSTLIATLVKIRARNANCCVMLLGSYNTAPSTTDLNTVYALGNGGAMYTGSIIDTDPSSVQAAKDRNLVTAYAIANTPAKWDKAVSLGFDIITTDLLGKK